MRWVKSDNISRELIWRVRAEYLHDRNMGRRWYVERTNLTVRHFTKRFARLGLGYSKKLCNHRHAISLFVAAYNFCKVHNTLGTTPAHGLRLTSEPWTIERLIEEATKTPN